MNKVLGILLCFVFVSADATLIGRAGGAAYYDDVLDITWLADANYAQTSGYDADGLMSWSAAQNWVGTLNTANHLGVNNWRLPTVIDTGAPGCNWSYNGTDCGYNVDTSTGEMAHLFYDTLGNLAFTDTSGSSPQPGWGLTNTSPFSHLQTNSYWSGTEYVPNSNLHAWGFNFGSGRQRNANKVVGLYAWAVADGDIAAVPVPAALWLFGSGLGLLGLLRRVQR